MGGWYRYKLSNTLIVFEIQSSTLIIVLIHLSFYIPEGYRKDACNDHQHDPQNDIRGVACLGVAVLPLDGGGRSRTAALGSG